MADFFEICKKPGLKANFARKLNAIIQNDIKPSNIKNLYKIPIPWISCTILKKNSENFLGKNLKINSKQLFKTCLSFKTWYGDFKYLIVFIDDNIAHVTMICCCRKRYVAIATR